MPPTKDPSAGSGKLAVIVLFGGVVLAFVVAALVAREMRSGGRHAPEPPPTAVDR